MNRIFRSVQENVEELNRSWSTIGSTVIIFLLFLSFLANVLQVISFEPFEDTVPIPLIVLILSGLIGLSALISIATLLSTSVELKKRSGITQLTNIYIDRRRGELRFGETRNVLMNLETIQGIFLGAFNLQNDKEASQNYLYETGFRVGQNFGDEFYDLINREQDIDDLSDLIDEWCEYDVEAGWGKFYFTRGKREDGSKIEDKGRITVRNNFLASESDDGFRIHYSMCSFMSGYIGGVIRVFKNIMEPALNPNERWMVRVSEDSCAITSQNHSCTFDFEIFREIVGEDG